MARYEVTAPDGSKYEITAPDGASEAQVMEYAKGQFNGAVQPEAKVEPPSVSGFMAENRARNNALMRGGWGSGVPQFAYDVGGKVTDLTGSPVAGGVANFLTNAIPTFLSGYRLGAPTSVFETPAKAVMQQAVKPGIADLESGAADKAMKTMLLENIKPTRGGMISASKKANELSNIVKQEIANSPATVNVVRSASPLRETYNNALNQVNPEADLNAVRAAWGQFVKSPLVNGKTEIPVQVAQSLKTGTYRALADKYGEIGSASTEAQKALARGLRDEIAKAVPGVVEPLKREAALRQVMDVAGRRSLMAGNNNMFGLGALRLDDPKSAATFLADRWIWLKAALAQNLYAAGKPELFAAPALLGSSTGPALFEELRKRQK